MFTTAGTGQSVRRQAAAMKTYLGEVCRDGTSWSIYFPEVHQGTICKRPERNDVTARMFLSTMLDIPLDDVRVTWR